MLLCVFSYAQNQQLIDSLRTKISATAPQEQFELLNDLAWEYRFSFPDSTFYYANLAYERGMKYGIKKGLARSLNIIGISFNYQGERLEALDYYNKAVSTATQYNDSAQLAYGTHNIGRLFFDQGLLSRAYEGFKKSMTIFENIRDSSGLAYVYQSFGNLYKVQRDYKKAEHYFLAAYDIRRKLGGSRDIMSALVYYSRFLQESNQWAKSIGYLKKADSTGQIIDDQINLAEIKTYLAEAYLKEGQLMEAEAIAREGLNVILSRKSIRLLPQAYHIMGAIHEDKRDYATARSYYLKSLNAAEKIRDLNFRMRAYYQLWKLSERSGDKREVLSNMNQYLILKDSINDLEVARQVERLEFSVEIERKEKENARNEIIIQQQKGQNLLLIGITSFVTIGLTLLWFVNKKRKEKNDQLERQNLEIEKQRQEITRQNEKFSKRNAELSDLNHEKDTLMGIVAHDLKSPLNRIQGVVHLMELEGNLTDDQKMYLNMMREASRAGLSLIKDLLDVHMLEEHIEPQLKPVDLGVLLSNKVQAFQPTADSKQIQLSLDRVAGEQVVTDEDYLSRILDNLLDNAIKFSERNTTVSISTGRTFDSFWISVKDQGPGFSVKDKTQVFQKFRKLSARPTGGETSNGLGLAIVKTLVNRLRGTIDLYSEPGRGTEFVMKFPTSERPQ